MITPEVCGAHIDGMLAHVVEAINRDNGYVQYLENLFGCFRKSEK
jgi:hypothetical protein